MHRFYRLVPILVLGEFFLPDRIRHSVYSNFIGIGFEDDRQFGKVKFSFNVE